MGRVGGEGYPLKNVFNPLFFFTAPPQKTLQLTGWFKDFE